MSSFFSRGCYFNNEKPLKFFKIYTPSNCQQECLSEKTLQQCNCVPFYLVRAPTTKICGSLDKKCAQSVEENFSFHSKSCRCFQKCNKIEFEFKASFSETFTTFISIVYDEEFFYGYVKKRVSDFEDLLATIGGFLGLILGISVITFIELIDFLIFSCRGLKFKKELSLNNIEGNMILKIIKRFGLSSSIHGVKHIVDQNKTVFEK